MAPTPAVSPNGIEYQGMFELEPMGEKLVDTINGIGPTYAKRLTRIGYNQACVLFGQYLVLKRNKELFIEWMWWKAKIPRGNALRAYTCLDDWFNMFIM